VQDYFRVAVRHPHLFQLNDSAAIAIHVEPVVKQFARDGLTREGYFKAVAAEPRLVPQKSATVIGNLEAVMSHYAADQLMRSAKSRSGETQPFITR
jgi:hypothetical protein